MRTGAAEGPRLLVLGVMIGRVRRRVRGEVGAELAKISASTLWWQVLRHLVEAGPSTQNELAEIAAQHAATLSRELQSMEKAGLVRRGRDRDDRRRQRVEVTARGRRKVEAWSPLVLAGIERALHRLSAAERQQLGALLQKILAEDR